MRFQVATLVAALLICHTQAAEAKPVWIPPAAQGWLDLETSTSFSTDLSAMCSNEIEMDGYGPAIHRCTANGH